MSERRPLLSASPRQSVEDFTQWTRTKSQKVNTKSEWSFDASDPVISDLPPTQDLPDTRPEWKGVIECPLPPMQYLPSPSTSVQVSPIPDTPALKESPKGNGNAVKVHDCGVSMSNEQDKRVWISADNRDRWCGERHRTLVLCFDGTGDQFDDDNSNIVQLLAMLRKDDNAQQLVYYQAGLGTYTDPMLKTPIASVVSMTLDQMIAWNLGSHVKDGYAFLMQNYTRGDKICIFGFSRGAYTARALAGMLQKVGLLPTCNHQQLPFAYEMYKREDKQGLDMSHAFKKTYSRAVTVDFLGVWDTVASVGLIPRYLPFIHENTGIRYLRHALALDERRVKFIPQFCSGTKPEPEEVNGEPIVGRNGKALRRHQSYWKAYEDLVNSKTDTKTNAEEVWFAGVHCDVGGGATPNWEENKLSRIPLRWMIRECFNCNTGILFDARMLQRIGLPVFKNALGEPELAPLYKFTPAPAPVKPYSRPVRKAWWKVLFAALWCPFALIGRLLFSWNKKPQKPEHWDGEEPPEFDLVDIPEDYELQNDLADSRTETHDQLEKKFLWVLLDWFPQRVKKQKAIINKLESGDSYKWLWNRGSGRKIPKTEIEEGLQVHRTVKMRLEQLGEAYAPQARPNIHIARVDEAGNKIKEPRRMTHYEWNNPNPEQWKWVGECELPKN